MGKIGGNIRKGGLDCIMVVLLHNLSSVWHTCMGLGSIAIAFIKPFFTDVHFMPYTIMFLLSVIIGSKK